MSNIPITYIFNAIANTAVGAFIGTTLNAFETPIMGHLGLEGESLVDDLLGVLITTSFMGLGAYAAEALIETTINASKFKMISESMPSILITALLFSNSYYLRRLSSLTLHLYDFLDSIFGKAKSDDGTEPDTTKETDVK